MSGVPYQEGMAVFIKDGIAVDPWGREVEGYGESQPEQTEATPQQPAEEEREDDQYDNMSADGLKEELRRRQDVGREIDTTGVRRKADLAQKLREDDQKNGLFEAQKPQD